MTVATQERVEALSANLAPRSGSTHRRCAFRRWSSGRRRASARARWVHLSQREFDLLASLAVAPDRIIRRERLYELVWGQKMPGRRRDVDVYVRKVRVKLADAAPRDPG